jgi:hypothetical protein
VELCRCIHSKCIVDFFTLPSPANLKNGSPRAAYAGSKAGIADYLCHYVDSVPEDKMRIIPFHPGTVYTSAAAARANIPKTLPIWDHPSLSAHTCVWLCGKDAAFLHGRYVWTNWDMDEVLTLKEKILADPGFLKIGVAGTNNATMEGLNAACTKYPVPDGWHPA